MLDTAGHIVLLNSAAESLLDVQTAAAAGKPLSEVLPQESIMALVKDEPAQDRFVDLTLEERSFRVKASPIQGEGESPEAYLLVFNDVSHYLLLNENMTLFLQTVSHDLRSPLTAAKGFVDMLGMVGELNEKQLMMKEKILTSIIDMSNLVEKVLDAGRLDPAMGIRQELRRDTCDPAQIVEKAMSTMLSAAHKKNLVLKKDVQAAVPMMNLDQMMLERSLINLVENAVKYTPSGGQIVVSARLRGNDLVLAVQDNGFGIPGEQLNTLFERGSRIRREEHRAVRGSGLGLFIVRNVAQLHGGDAYVESEEGQGSTFSIVIPIDGKNVIGAG